MRKEFSKKVTFGYLQECFIYWPDTGRISWKARPLEHFKTVRGWRCFNSRDAGRDCGSLQPNGYMAIRLDQQFQYIHRIAWILGSKTEIPEGMVVDHVNGIKLDNRFANLRLATKSQNGRNSKKQSRNLLPKGVHFDKSRNAYVANVRTDGRMKSRRFASLQEADAQARLWREQDHGQFHNHGDNSAS